MQSISLSPRSGEPSIALPQRARRARPRCRTTGIARRSAVGALVSALGAVFTAHAARDQRAYLS